MPDESSVILQRIGEKSKVRPVSGTFVSYSSTGCVVDIGSGRVDAAFGSPYLPEVGESVLVFFIDGTPFLMGPSVPRPSTGTVLTLVSNRVELQTALGKVGPMPYVGSAPAIGAEMRILWHGGGLAFTTTVAAIITPPPPPPTSQPTTHIDEFDCIETGTWNTSSGAPDSASSRFNDEVWASNTTIGFWFYGTKVPDTIPAAAPIQKVQIYIAARQIQGGSPVFTTHDRPNGPGTGLSGGTAIGVSNYSWVDLPLSFGDQLRRGGGRFGVGVRHGGYNIFKSRASDGQTGKLRITSVY